MILSEEANIETKWKNHFVESEFPYHLSLGPNPFRIILLSKGRKLLKPPVGKLTKMNTKENQILIKKNESSEKT